MTTRNTYVIRNGRIIDRRTESVHNTMKSIIIRIAIACAVISLYLFCGYIENTYKIQGKIVFVGEETAKVRTAIGTEYEIPNDGISIGDEVEVLFNTNGTNSTSDDIAKNVSIK